MSGRARGSPARDGARPDPICGPLAGARSAGFASGHLVGEIEGVDAPPRRRARRCARHLPSWPATRCRSTRRRGTRRGSPSSGLAAYVPCRGRRGTWLPPRGVTIDDTTRAPAASGSSRASSAVNRSTSSRRLAARYSSAADSEIAMLWCPAGAPEAAVRSKTNCTGESIAAMNGSWSTRRSYSRWTFTMGERPSSTAAACSSKLPAGSSPATASCGTATTTASASRCSPSTSTHAPCPVPWCTALTLAPRRTSAPAASSARRAASPCSSCSGTFDQPRSAPSLLSSRPVLNTFAARSSDASSDGRLTVARMTRSHSAARACSLTPCASSHAPNVRSSREWSPRSRRLSASAARAAPRRSYGRAGGGTSRVTAARCSGLGPRPRRRWATGPPGRWTGTSMRSCRVTRPLDPMRSRNSRYSVQQRMNTCCPLS